MGNLLDPPGLSCFPNMSKESADYSKKDDLSSQTDLETSLNHTTETPVEDHNKEVYRKSWSRNLLILAYAILIFTAFVETFAGDSTSGLDSYATSNFNAHALISTAAVVYKITAIVSYPLMAKLSDFFGRAEGFAFGILVYTMSYVLYAACQNVSSYVAAELLYAVGRVGYRIFQQIFIADTTSLIDRGLWSQLPDAIAAVPSLYIGSIIQDAIMDHSTWRWGYGMWSIILSVSCFPLIGIMYYMDRRAKQTGEVKIYKILQGLPEGRWYTKTFWFLYDKLDIVGCALMTAGLALFFIPLSMTGKSSPYKWHEAKLIAMLVVGGVLFGLFVFWNSRMARTPFVPKQALNNPTMILACVMVALDWCTNSSFSTYFKTALQVGAYTSVGEASRIDNSKKACLQIFSIVGGLMMKYYKKTKLMVYIGVPMYLLGHGLLVHFVYNNGGTSSKPLLYMAEVFIGAGRGIYQTSLQVSIQAIAGAHGIPMSTAFFLAFNSVGSLIGSCIAGGVWNTIVLRKLRKYLPEEDVSKATKIYKSIKVALKYKKGTETRDAIARAYLETVQLIGWIGLGVIAPNLILMLFVRNVKLTDKADIYDTDSESVDGEVAEKVSDKESEKEVVEEQVWWKKAWKTIIDI